MIAVTPEESDVAAASFAAYGRNPSVRRFFNESERAWIAYRRWGPLIVALGGPTGEDGDELAPLRRAFVERFGRRRIVWYGAGRPERDGVDVRFGQEAVIHLDAFTTRGRRMQNLRTSASAARRAGQTVVEGTWAELPERVREEIRSIQLAWRARHRLRYGFTASAFQEACGDRRPWVVAGGDRVEAFVSWLPAGDGRGWVLDLMRRRGDAVRCSMDLVLLSSLELARDRGRAWASLGVAPLDSSESRSWLSCNSYFSPPSLRAYKEKFRPDWQDRYIVLPPLPAARALAGVAVAGVHLASIGARGVATPTGGGSRTERLGERIETLTVTGTWRGGP